MAGTSTVVEVSFGPFRLDASNARLLRDGKPVALTPKAFDVLHHLVSRPQRLVTKDELLSAVWPDVIVSDASIKVCVREIRKALDDCAKTPTYIETVHRRGYRFIARMEGEGSENGASESGTNASGRAGRPPAAAAVSAEAPAPAACTFVGRDEEIARLKECFDLARSGRRQCAFVSGGPGTGKTALAESFIRQLTGGSGGAGAAVVLGG